MLNLSCELAKVIHTIQSKNTVLYLNHVFLDECPVGAATLIDNLAWSVFPPTSK